MSLYSRNFDLLPRPPRSVFSIGDEATRATFPDFADVAQFRSFLHQLFVYDMSNIKGIFVQLKVGASIICLLVVLVLAIIARRMYDRSFWVIRIMKRPSGMVIVPNAMLCFSGIEGIYGALFVALMWQTAHYYESRDEPPTNWPLWLLLTWCPLIVGASWAAWGTYFATPNKLQSSSFGVGKQHIITRFFDHALVINTIGLVIPFVICISVAIPSAVCSVRFNSALKRERAWQAMYGDAQDFTQPMVLEAQQIWFDLIAAMRVMTITFIMWTIWALGMCITYTWVSLRLIFTIGGELKRRESKGPRQAVATTRIFSSQENEANPQGRLQAQAHRDQQGPAQLPLHMTPQDKRLSLGTTARSLAPTDGFGSVRDARKMSLVSNLTNEEAEYKAIQMSNLQSPAFSDTNVFSDRTVRMDEGTLRAFNHQQKTQGEKVNGQLEEQVEDEPPMPEVEQRRTLMPNLIMRPPASVSTGRPPPNVQKKELRKAFIHVCIQFFAISPACACFMAVALLMAVTTYGSTEQPWKEIMTLYSRYIAIALVSVNWTTVFFGSITLFAIAQRTYEPVFNSLHFTSTNHSASAGIGGTANDASGELIQSPATGALSPRARNSFTLGRMLGRPLQRAPSQKRNFIDDKSTFFETRTRQQQTMSNQHENSSSNSGHGANQSSNASALNDFDRGRMQSERPQDESMIDIEGAAVPAYHYNDLHHDQADSFDIARRGLFIERTVVTVEEESSDERNHHSSSHGVIAPSLLPHKTSTGTFGAEPAQINSARSPTKKRFEQPPSSASTPTHRQQTQFPSRADANAFQPQLVDSDDDDDYFRGGAGRRYRPPRSSKRNSESANAKQQHDKYEAGLGNAY